MAEQALVKVPPRGSPSVSRAAAILTLLAGRPGGWSLTQIAAALGLAKSSTLTIMMSLEDAGLVSRHDHDYELGVGVLALAGGFLRGMDLVDLFKRELAASTVLKDEIAHLALLSGTDVLYLARHIGRAPLPVTAMVGDRFPASITAVGSALLAQLDDAEIRQRYASSDWPQWTPKSTASLDRLLAKIARVRDRGYAVDEGETHPNVAAYAMLVRRSGNHAEDFAVGCSLRATEAKPRQRRAALEELAAIRDVLESGNELD